MSETETPGPGVGATTAPTEPLGTAAEAPPASEPSRASTGAAPKRRDLSLRLAELTIFLAAVLGAIALGLGISDYLQRQPYVAVYLIAYAAFRITDLLLREESMLGTDAAHWARRTKDTLPVLLLLASAPFERTYLYGGEAPHWLGGFGLLIELVGIWLALGARIQIGYFSAGESVDSPRRLVCNGLYRYIRHPSYAGEFMVLFAWPFEYAAPITAVLAIVVGIMVLQRRVAQEETALLALYGDHYAEYIRATDRVIPNVW